MARLVIVEDEKIIAEDIKWTLINFDYDVVGMVSEPEEIIPEVSRLKPDLILMDIKLGDGFEGIEAARRIQNELKLPVIFITAYSDNDTIRKILTTNPYGYLLKPYNEKELKAAIEMALLRHKMEVALKDSEKKYRNLVENLQEGILLVETNGLIKFANKKALEILQASGNEIFNKNLCDFFPKDVKKKLISKDDEEKNLETKYKRKYLRLLSTPYKENDNHKGCLVVINDFTKLKTEQLKRKQTMQKLKSIESRLTTILNNLPHVVIYETNIKEMYLSENIEKLLGYNRELFSQGPLFYMSKIHNEDLKIYKDKFKKWKNDNFKGTLTRWYRIKRKDGEYIWVEEKMVKISPDSASSFMGIIVDITNLKKAEEEKKQMQKILLVSQKMEIVGKLAGGIAHDFNNLLMVINGLSEKLLDKLPANDPSYKDIKKIHKSGEKASQLVNKLLGFSKRQITNPQVINVNKYLINFWDILKSVVTGGIELIPDLNYSSEPLEIKIDPVQFEQILMNLVVNSKDAIKEEGVIRISTYFEDVSKKIMAVDGVIKKGKYVVLEVSDNGSGINPEYLEKIFEPFFTTKKRNKGTGLGLSNVFGIVKQNKGFIRVESTLNKGTTFYLYFPKYSSEKDKKQKNKNSINILFVDDEKDILDFITEILTDNGYNVFPFNSPTEALDFYKNSEEKMDLVITDYTMPEMNGNKLIESLKNIKDDFKTVFITGYADTEYFQSNKDKDVFVLTKPFTPRELIDFLDKTL